MLNNVSDGEKSSSLKRGTFFKKINKVVDFNKSLLKEYIRVDQNGETKGKYFDRYF